MAYLTEVRLDKVRGALNKKTDDKTYVIAGKSRISGAELFQLCVCERFVSHLQN